MKSYQITEYCHHFIENHVNEGDFCIDATAGNGLDTEFLCSLVGDHGRVLAFDIQETAVEHTNERLWQHGYSQIGTAICESHSAIDLYAAQNTVSCIVFNFGYLPGGDHSLSTKASTSIEAISKGLPLLTRHGLMSLCIYSGGDTGYEERDAILSYLKTLDPKKYIVILSSYYNRPNDPPIPAFIIRL